MPVSHIDLVVDHRVISVDTLDLPSFYLSLNSNLTANYMAYLRCQGIDFNDENDPLPDNIID